MVINVVPRIKIPRLRPRHRRVEPSTPGGSAVRRTPVSAAAVGRRLNAGVIPWLRPQHLPTFWRVWNSSWRPPGAAVEPGSPSCCRETLAPRLAPGEPSSYPQSPAYSTCPVPRPSSGRDHIRGGDRCYVASPIPSSYCLRSRRVARRALMIRTRPSRPAWATKSTRLREDRPIVISRSSSSERSGSQKVSAEGSRKTDAASSNVTRCFLRFAPALTGSHS